MTGPDAPAPTTARRMRSLLVALGLPWVVCGGGLWAVVACTPGVSDWAPPEKQDLTSGLSFTWFDTRGFSFHPRTLRIDWNPAGYQDRLYESFGGGGGRSMPEPTFNFPNAGIGLMAGDAPAGRWAALGISCWWLVPFPLLWSGFNLWRWTRRS